MTDVSRQVRLDSHDDGLSSANYSIETFASHMEMPPEELENLFRTFIDEFDSELSDLKAAYEINDYKRMYGIAHNIKGIAANMEMEDLFKSCKHLNDLLKDILSSTSPGGKSTSVDSDNYEPSVHLTLIHEIECLYDQTKDILLDFYHDLKV